MRLPTLLLLVALVGCRASSPSRPVNLLEPEEVAGPEAASALGTTLGPGDVVEVRVYQEPDQSGSWRLSAEGTIDYPLCGKVRLEGLTSSEAADALALCLKQWLLRPEVSVLIREYTSKKVFVLGEVQKPGSFSYDDGMTVVQAIAMAGGFNRQADRNNTHVTRLGAGPERKIRAPVDDINQGRKPNFLLQPGDIVFVPESIF